ncbi:MAG: hypothetical protein UX06_C0039G0004 [Candidatus Giovannonibacteria bacterium GW2011_GWA2_45_21]|uniref:Uncharacterized protein n=1 Tax=Candidatus Giovannonibacteria bacterium GW2011_GWA2_45_21 TaxID=1618649 RepID=A0A0G1Q4M1_9BACT|nr:MAG: hypothetical protein UX06_C0039G0004 [Candidatus Giovannonibacteria bacterium GW2011_GWA2_45_21]
MFTKTAFIIVFLLMILPYSASAAAKLEVSGWLPYWRAASSTADVLPHLSDLKEVNPFGYSVKSDGTLADLFFRTGRKGERSRMKSQI